MADLNIGNSTANVIVNAKHNGAVNPQINNTYDLGTSTLRWKNIYGDTFVGSLNGNAATATKATQDSVGQQINTTYIKGLSVSGRTITYTKGDGSTGTITTQDNNTTYSAGAGLSLSGTKFSIDSTVITKDSMLQTTNPFGGSSLYISKIDNAFYAAQKRWTVTGSFTGSSSGTYSISQLSALFDGNYETVLVVPKGCIAKIRITFDTNETGTYGGAKVFPGYPYGYAYISYYYNATPSAPSKMRMYCNYEPHVIGEHEYTMSTFNGSYSSPGASSGNSAVVEYVRQPNYAMSYIEFEINGATNYDVRITQIEMRLERPDSSKTPFLSKYGAETLYYPLTAPQFNGNLSGNASTATKLQTARTISLIGSITGSGTFDGSGNLSITTTTNHTHAAATTSANGFMSSDDKAKLDGITASADAVSFSRSLTSGTKVGTITINGTGTDLYAPTNTDTKNTAGSSNTSSKIFLVGATSQASNATTYSHDTTYVDDDEVLVSSAFTAGTNHIIAPKGGQYSYTSTSTVKGYLKITLPVSMNDATVRFYVDIYNYQTDTMVTYMIGGYKHENSSWVNTSAVAYGRKGSKLSNLDVHFGNDGSKCAIYIGSEDTTWNYPQVMVRDILVGFGHSALDLDSGWSIGFTTTLGTISTTVYNPYIGYNAYTADNVAWSGITNKPSYYDAKAIKSIIRYGTTFTATHLDGTTSTFTQQDNNTVYSHPAGSAASKSSGLYKFSTDSTSHISSVTNVTKSDITALGIPAHDTTYDSMSVDEGTSGTATTNRVLTAANLKGIINAHAPTKTGSGASGTWGINISGSSKNISYPAQLTTDDAIDAFNTGNVFQVSTWNNTSSPGATNGIIINAGWTNATYGAQIAIDDDPTYFMALRQKNNGGWNAWKRIPMGDGTGASGTWGISISGNAATATKVVGSYTANGGKQQPNYFGTNRVGFLMMNTTVNNNSDYKDWIIMDCYSGSDVGGGVALGVNRQRLGAYIMRSAAERTSWTESAELLHTSNYTSYTVKKDGTGASGTWGISVSGNAATATKLATARTISLTGSVTGSGTFDGSGNLSIATTTNHTHAAATTSANGFMSSSDKSKLDGIAMGANKYSHPTYTSMASGLYKITVDGTGHVSAATAVAKSDITALGIPSTNTTYSAMTGATTSAAGAAGLVPAPAKGSASRYLRSDGTWQVPPDTNTTYSVATTSANGLMSKDMVTKLNGIDVTHISNINTLPSGNVGFGYYSTYDQSEGGVIAYITISVAGIAAVQYKIGPYSWQRRFRFTQGNWGAWGK